MAEIWAFKSFESSESAFLRTRPFRISFSVYAVFVVIFPSFRMFGYFQVGVNLFDFVRGKLIQAIAT